MRILYLTHQYLPHHVGGTEIYTRGLVRRARAAGHETLIVTCRESASGDPRDFHTEKTEHEGAKVVEIHFNLSVTESIVRCEYDNPFVGQTVAAVLKSYRPDVVHVMHALKLSGAALEACFDARVPVVVTLCDYWFLCPRHTLLDHAGAICSGPDRPGKCVPCMQQLHGVPRPAANPADRKRFNLEVATLDKRSLFLRRLLLQARRLVALSEFQKRVFVQNGFPPDKIDVIHHGLELTDLDVAGGRVAPRLPRPLERLGFIGSIVPHKGLHVLLEALTLVPHLRIEALIHGHLRPNDLYVALVEALAAHDARVKLLGGFEPNRFGTVLRDLDVLAVPATWDENEPLVVKAALHVGVPILASRIGSLEGLVQESKNGWFVPANDPSAWAAALLRLASAPIHPPMPTPMKSMDENAREWLAIYEQLERTENLRTRISPVRLVLRHFRNRLAGLRRPKAVSVAQTPADPAGELK